LQEEEIGGGGEEDWTSPIADEGKEAYGKDVVAADAVVGAGEVDGGDGV